MKRAYLFGAAALLILLIVVAYVSFSREKKDEDVCVRPPPPVGPTADPDILTLISPDQQERLLRLRDALDGGSKDVDESTSRKLFADGDVMSTDELNERLQGLRDPPTGGPLPVDPLLQSDPCVSACRPRARTPYTPRTPYIPKSRPDFGDSPVVSLDRLSELKERQRQRTNEWTANMRAKTLQTPTTPQSSGCMSPVLVRPQLVTPGASEFEPWSNRERFEARLFALEKAVAEDMRRLPDIEDKLIGLEDEMLKMLEATGGAGPYQPADRTYDDEALMGDRLETIEEERFAEY